jgi:protein-tyrosine phosphatase
MYSEVVTDSLYLGSFEDVQNSERARAHKIQAIFNMASGECQYNWIKQNHGFKIHEYNLKDNYTCDISVHFDSVADLINDYVSNGSPVFIHCFLGKSRSAAFVLAYLMKYKGLSLQQAFGHVSSIREIQPNIMFIKYLMTYEQRLHSLDTSTFDLHAYKVVHINAVLELNDLDRVRRVYAECRQDYNETIDELLK